MERSALDSAGTAPQLWSMPVSREPRARGEAQRLLRDALERYDAMGVADDVVLVARGLLEAALALAPEGVQLTLVRTADDVRLQISYAAGKGPPAQVWPLDAQSTS
jgi:hypothetical protein